MSVSPNRNFFPLDAKQVDSITVQIARVRETNYDEEKEIKKTIHVILVASNHRNATSVEKDTQMFA